MNENGMPTINDGVAGMPVRPPTKPRAPVSAHYRALNPTASGALTHTHTHPLPLLLVSHNGITPSHSHAYTLLGLKVIDYLLDCCYLERDCSTSSPYFLDIWLYYFSIQSSRELITSGNTGWSVILLWRIWSKTTITSNDIRLVSSLRLKRFSPHCGSSLPRTLWL